MPIDPTPNRVRAALAAGRPAWGTWVQTRSAEACEAAAATGFDFVVVDMQHGPHSVSEAATLLRGIHAYGASPVVRLPDSSPRLVGHLLDAGAHGILAPDLRTADDARAVVEAARYAPDGTRGACPTVPATAHGAIPWAEYRSWADEQVMVWGLIETPDAVENIEKIVATGLHAVVLGPFDLAMALGLDGDVTHPDVVAGLARVTAAATAAGVETVAVLFDEVTRIADGAQAWLDRGCRIITASSDRWCLAQGWATALAGLRSVD
ncbi:HpcH/HpaI aldolase family protein [Mycobacterium sp. NPDC003449]